MHEDWCRNNLDSFSGDVWILHEIFNIGWQTQISYRYIYKMAITQVLVSLRTRMDILQCLDCCSWPSTIGIYKHHLTIWIILCCWCFYIRRSHLGWILGVYQKWKTDRCVCFFEQYVDVLWLISLVDRLLDFQMENNWVGLFRIWLERVRFNFRIYDFVRKVYGGDFLLTEYCCLFNLLCTSIRK
jgi:hypothetical protein